MILLYNKGLPSLISFFGSLDGPVGGSAALKLLLWVYKYDRPDYIDRVNLSIGKKMEPENIAVVFNFAKSPKNSMKVNYLKVDRMGLLLNKIK